MNILLTSTSFIDTPGKHQDLLKSHGFFVDTLRGPVSEEKLLSVIHKYDGVICGDDHFTEVVIKKGSLAKLKVISKYGVGLDSINREAAKKYNVTLTNCPGVNQVSVAEHVFGLLLCHYRNIHTEYNITKQGGWTRLSGEELYGKTIGVAGFGAVGKEVALRAKAWGLQVLVFDKYLDTKLVREAGYNSCSRIEDLLSESDILSLHLPLTKETEGIISFDRIRNNFKKGAVLVNTARGKLLDFEGLQFGLENKIISGYLTDVLDSEPMPRNYPLLKYSNVLITPHIGSRTLQAVQKQGIMAVENLVKHITHTR